MMNRIYDFDESASLSSDSGMESAEETRPSSATSDNSSDDWPWNECSGLGYPLDYDAAFPLVQNYCMGLVSGDVSIIRSSAQHLLHLCRSGFSETLLSFVPEIFVTLRTVILAIDVSKHPDLIHCLSGIFYYLTENDTAIYLVPPDSYIAFVAKLLSFPLESVLYYTVAGLHNLLDHKSLRDKFRTPLILILLIQILWTCFLYDKSFHPPVTCNPYLAFASSTSLSKFLSIACDSLYLLAHRNEMSKRLIHAKQGVIPLLYFVHTYQFEKTQSVCVRLLRILSTHPQTKRDILKNDPTLRFFKHSANSTFQQISLDAFWTLRNLSDQCASLANHQMNEISEILLQKLRSIEESSRCWKAKIYSPYDLQDRYTISRCISGTLANFTCRNPFTKLFLVDNGAVPLLARLLTLTMNELASHSTLCQATVFGGPCMAPPKYDPIPPSLLSCLCGRRSVSLSNLQATVDCMEAALRCLSHLTSSHQRANEALHQLAYDWADGFLTGGKEVCWMIDLLRLTSHDEGVYCKDHPIHPVPEQWDALDRSHVFQLAKAWLSLARNRLAGGVWRSPDQEAALRSAVGRLELFMFPSTESGKKPAAPTTAFAATSDSDEAEDNTDNNG
ncbi:unnamed protein product [Hydatigera taeniaeformis]|uniref:Junction plakoglobin n=1 Tax=Hydatigena taeniaeformis TaxID=6205 RepID=A0A0R3X2B8_HYDTA|nr:unnamed protein product [Hydatigera taeniaeformis]